MFYRQTIKELEEKVAELNLVVHNALGMLVKNESRPKRTYTKRKAKAKNK